MSKPLADTVTGTGKIPKKLGRSKKCSISVKIQIIEFKFEFFGSNFTVFTEFP